MADEVDRTAERLENEAPYLLRAARKPEGPKPSGFCHFCEAPLAEGIRFCDSDCRDDFDRLQKRGPQ